MGKVQKLTVAKHLIYTGLILVFYLFQVTPGLLPVPSVKPIYLIGFVVAIAMHEGEFAGGLYGLYAGILCDSGADYLFGLGAVFFLIAGTAIGILVLCLMRNNLRSAALFTGAVASVYLVANFFFLYGMWGYEQSYLMLLWHTLPSLILTVAFGALAYWIVHAISDRFAQLCGG